MPFQKGNKFGLGNIGNKNHLGFHHSEKTRESIRNKLKGRHVSPATEFKKGERSGNWKGGISSLYFSIRSSDKYKLWRSEIYQRDRWACQTCGGKRDIEMHHIINFAGIIEKYKIRSLEEAEKCNLLWDLNNGVTLCKDCHKLITRKKVKVRNYKLYSREQIREFLDKEE